MLARTLRSAGAAADFALRLAYFALAPAVLALLARLLPMAGVLANVALALFVFAFAQVARVLAFRWWIVGKVLGRAFAFDDFYRTHPPKPFVFYALYPLLLPYVLLNRVTRRELALYRGMNVVALVILVVTAGWDYFVRWRPELGPRPFLKVWVATVVVQLGAILAFVMPLASTIVAYQIERKTRRLAVLLGVATMSLVVMTVTWSRKRHGLHPLPTLSRLGSRANAEPKRARRAMEAALGRARTVFTAGEGELAWAGKVGEEILGPPIDEVRPILATYFKEDEADAFHLVLLSGARDEVLVLYALPSSSKPPVWLGLSRKGAFVDDVDALPKGAVAAMRRAVKQ